jgi:hypothetical protein
MCSTHSLRGLRSLQIQVNSSTVLCLISPIWLFRQTEFVPEKERLATIVPSCPVLRTRTVTGIVWIKQHAFRCRHHIQTEEFGPIQLEESDIGAFPIWSKDMHWLDGSLYLSLSCWIHKEIRITRAILFRNWIRNENRQSSSMTAVINWDYRNH